MSSPCRKVTPNNIRIAVFVVVIAGFVTLVDLVIQAFVPALSVSLGVFIPLIVVNCIIIGRAEAYASKNGVGASTLDGIFQGLGYTVVLIVMCVIREFLGSGTFGAGILNGGNGYGFSPRYGALMISFPSAASSRWAASCRDAVRAPPREEKKAMKKGGDEEC